MAGEAPRGHSASQVFAGFGWLLLAGAAVLATFLLPDDRRGWQGWTLPAVIGFTAIAQLVVARRLRRQGQ
ncbi:hypothetical protein JL108_16200 [Aeromicrobium sp. YIM 150415]|uniref:hypothetical protein n=1 Tax=Aeromicrobium sp. YIM 150415 TaxID=2803912 RepID=UPI001966A42D|nr:hypothetical protein [Aeromicrobium sp. YIM 150415]MBM9464995.1 hypothetical protein [Aeromicrobium sp. YIM 150415]